MPARRKCGRGLRLAGNGLRLAGNGRRRRGQRGAGFWSFLKKAHNWIKQNKVISRGAKFLGSTGLVPQAGTIGTAAGTLGYGRRRRVRRIRRR